MYCWLKPERSANCSCVRPLSCLIRFSADGSKRQRSCRYQVWRDRREKRVRGADGLKGADFAHRALEVAGDDAHILANAALALAYLGEDIGAMMALVDRALALNPSFARGWHLSGTLRLWAGQPDIAIRELVIRA
jgi:hypothetical protein